MLTVEKPGFSAIQDLGRNGYQNQGIGESGAMDDLAARTANVLLGNPDNTAVIEITLGAAAFRIGKTQWFALTGADLSATVDDRPVPLCAPILLESGSLLRFGNAKRGCRAYLAVRGGFAVDPVLGSASTDASAGLGGVDGRWLRRGDTLAFRSEAVPARRIRWHTCWANPAFEDDEPLWLIPGPAWPELDAEAQRECLARTWTVGKDSDRMGLRLMQNLATARAPAPVLSTGVAFGSVQLPPDGRPIILAADRQTTGGYPIIGTVATVSHPRLAQCRPGDGLRFAVIDVAQAQALWRARERRFRDWQEHMMRWWRD